MGRTQGAGAARGQARVLTGEQLVTVLATHHDMSFAAVQKHVAVLEGAGLATKHPHGRERMVRGDVTAIRKAQTVLDSYEQLWRSRIERLDALLADFAAPVERLWNAYADPRLIERFWGPEGYPATFTRHDFAVGGQTHYYMTGTDGDEFHGLWEYLEIKPHARAVVYDKFATEPGVANTDAPLLHMTLTFEGPESSMSQLDALLAELASAATDQSVDA